LKGSRSERLFGYRCEYCEGTVRPERVPQEIFPHKRGFVILEDVVIGICDHCLNRYYRAETIQRVDAVATGESPRERTVRVPVAHATR